MNIVRIVILQFFLIIFSCTTNGDKSKYLVIKNVKYDLLKPEKYLNRDDYLEVGKFGSNNRDKIISVFHYYGIEVKSDKNNRIVVPFQVLKDSNFVRSILVKSIDEEWLNTHIGK